MRSGSLSLADKFGVVLLAGVLGLIVWRLKAAGTAAPVPIGAPLPSLESVSWLNVRDGEVAEIAGKLLVVDCWATWCGPCRAELPRMALAAAHYGPLGVQFIGVTSETSAEADAIKDVIESTPGFEWPVAYEGGEFLAALGVRVIPTVILFGADGKVRWSGVGSEGLEDALDAALAAARR